MSKSNIKIFVLFLNSFFLVVSCEKSKPPQEFGVNVLWKYGGATSSYPWIEVWADTKNGRLVESPIIFGGIENPKLSYKDVNGDGISEIVFGDSGTKQILSYEPLSEKFIVIRNDMKSREY